MTAGTAARSYRPGPWFGIFGDHATVLLPPSEKPRVGTLWALVDDGAGFDVVLDALISEGLRDLPGFVLVASDDGETRVVIRGEARAWFTTGNDTHEVAGTDVTTWAERSFAGVTATRIVVGPAGTNGAGEGSLPIDSGLVRVSEVRAPGAASSHEEPAPPVPPEPEPTPQPAPTIEHDGDTRSSPGAESDSIAGEAHSAVARLVFSSGDDVEVDRAVLVGRAPEARRVTVGDQSRLVTVPSPAHEISATHLEIRPGAGADHGSAVVTDLRSTNGTVLVQPGLPPEDLPPGIAVPLVPGAILDLGDGVTIQVIDP